MFNIVLVEPEIPQNTGNIGRSVISWSGTLHLVKPLGFSLDDKNLKRAGLDYWKEIDLKIWESFDEFLDSVPLDKLHFFSTKGKTRYDLREYKTGDYLIFGPETRGLPADIIKKFQDKTAFLPMKNLTVRSLNLSNCAAVILFEAVRQNNFGE